MALVMTAVKHSAVVANHTEVVGLLKDASGKLNGARVRDNLTGKEWNVKAKVRSLADLHRFVQLTVFHRV